MFECISTLEKVRRDMDDNIYNFTRDGECTGCGSCCSNLLPMNGKEIKEIRRYIRKHDIKECRRMFPAVKQPLDMTCPFLDISKGKDKCRIYPVRPFVCREFICDNEQRAKVKREELCKNRRIVDVRREFFESN